MVMKEDKQRLRKVLLDAISLLCKNGLPVETEFCIEATIGITLNEDDVVLVSFKEIIKPDQVTSSVSARVRSELNQRQPLDKEHILSVPAVENHSGDDNNELNDNSPDIINQIDTNADTSQVSHPVLISDEFKTEYEPFRVPEATPRSLMSKRKRPYEYHSNMCSQETTLKTDSASSEVNYRQTFKHSVPSSTKLRKRQAISEEPVNDAPVTIKEETRDVIDNNYVKGENDGHIEWSGDADNVGQEDDSWMFQEVYESGGSSYNSSSYAVSSRVQSHHTSQPVKLDGEAGLSGRLCKTDTILQSWNSPDHVTQTDEGLGSQTPNSRRQWSATRSGSSLDQGAIVSRALQNLTRAATFDQSAASLQPGDSTAAVFCQICGARLASAATLVKHIKGTHLAMSMCQCEICGEQFKWTMQLCRHRKRYHANEMAVPNAGDELDGTFDSDQVILDL